MRLSPFVKRISIVAAIFIPMMLIVHLVPNQYGEIAGLLYGLPCLYLIMKSMKKDQDDGSTTITH